MAPLKSLKYPGNHDEIPSPHKTENFIDNKFVASSASEWLEVHDPATNKVVTLVPKSTPSELEVVVASAKAAFPKWKATSIMRRQQILFKLTSLIREHMDDLATSITTEQGKTFADAKGDVLRGLQVCETACGITTQLQGEVLEVAKDMETRSYREPLGVVAAICPFNFPAMIPLWSLPIAIATGNVIILKPSERTPGASMLIAELCQIAGVPDGVVNVIHGAHETVNFLIDEPSIKAISFVGSNKAGEYIHGRASAKGKRVQANLGAKNHAALLPDANKAQAMSAIAGAAFGAAGQRCMALSAVVLVGAAKEWVGDLVKAASELTLGPGFGKDSDLGPVISPASRQRCEDIIASAEADGATVALDGRGKKPEGFPDGNWVRVVLSQHVSPPANYEIGLSDSNHRRQASHEVLPGGDLRASANLRRSRHDGPGHRHHQQQPIRKRCHRFHTVRLCGICLPKGRGSRPGRRQRAHPRPAAHVLLHGQQSQRRRDGSGKLLRQGRHQVLHAVEDGH